jgi:CDP-paratose 2-epimerase
MSFNYRHILITGGAGFVGSNLAVWYKTAHPELRVTVADNLKRRGSELNLPRLRQAGIEFVHADIRNPEDLGFANQTFDLILECSAEPSVLAGYSDGPTYVINTNLSGTVNCLELARRCQADIIFLSTSRVYPVSSLNRVNVFETPERLVIEPRQDLPGVSVRGIAENFPLEGARSLYGATKLCSELLMAEYADMYGLRYIINRCGVLTGPWQMGKADQGVFALWLAHHYFKRPLSYIGWGGLGKQVRDLLHINDLARLLDLQLASFEKVSGQTYNVGGGESSSLSLLETTRLCQTITGNEVPIASEPQNRPADLKLYITDNRRITAATGWEPAYSPLQTLQDIYQWIRDNEGLVSPLWSK